MNEIFRKKLIEDKFHNKVIFSICVLSSALTSVVIPMIKLPITFCGKLSHSSVAAVTNPCVFFGVIFRLKIAPDT